MIHPLLPCGHSPSGGIHNFALFQSSFHAQIGTLTVIRKYKRHSVSLIRLPKSSITTT